MRLQAGVLAGWYASLLLPRSSSSTASTRSPPPNLVIFFADNLGWGDIGAYGQPSARTPAIDSLAAEGMRFLDWNSAAAVCSPSRACLLTGRLAVRTGVYPMTFQADSVNGLPRNETTLAEHLKKAGYSTKMIGKVRAHQSAVCCHQSARSLLLLLADGTTAVAPRAAAAVPADHTWLRLVRRRAVQHGHGQHRLPAQHLSLHEHNRQ